MNYEKIHNYSVPLSEDDMKKLMKKTDMQTHKDALQRAVEIVIGSD